MCRLTFEEQYSSLHDARSADHAACQAIEYKLCLVSRRSRYRAGTDYVMVTCRSAGNHVMKYVMATCPVCSCNQNSIYILAVFASSLGSVLSDDIFICSMCSALHGCISMWAGFACFRNAVQAAWRRPRWTLRQLRGNRAGALFK